jgi:Chitobiase/beta-hexosaminidase C-terminal domain/Fibronectin type III domain
MRTRTRAGADPTATSPPRLTRTARALTAGLAGAALAATAVLAAAPASAAVPQFPDNILVFPNRDFVSIDGFANHAGEQITVEVARPGIGVIGSASGTTASAAVIAAGNPAIEVNHPGGICWGAGGGLNVTPDIQIGDVVSVKFGGVVAGDTTTGDAEVTGSQVTGNTLTVQGHIGQSVNPAFLEQRIIAPDLVDNPTVGKRSVAAIPGPLVQSAKGNYQSGMTVDVPNQTFTATYVFDTPATADTAGAGDMRVMSWQDQDPAGNRQGLTIAEFGLLGGPGMGGCAPAATQTVAKSPINVTAVQNGSNVDVAWTPAAQIPGTAPVIGYTVRAVDNLSTGGAQNEVGRRTSDVAARSMSLPTTLAGKRIEVRVLTDAGESWPPGIPGVGGPVGDTTIPTVSASPAGGFFTTAQTVTLTSNEPTAQIVYTLDGTDPLVGADAGNSVIQYAGPITIPVSPTPVTLRYVAFDAANNASLAKSETYTFGAPRAPGAPTINSVTAGSTTANVRWTAPADPGTSPITGYTVTATPPAPGTPVSVTTVASATTADLNGLTNGVQYSVTVSATSAAGTTASAPQTVTPVPTEVVTVTSAIWKAGDFRITGTGSVTGATISIRTGGFAGPVATTTLVPAPIAPASVGTWTVRIRTGPLAAAPKPGQIWVTSSGGGQVGPVTVN